MAILGLSVMLIPCGNALYGQTNIDMQAAGTLVHHEILGANWDLRDLQNYPYAFDIPDGTMARGVAGGLDADTFDWQKATGGRHYATMDYLRDLRDSNSSGMITVNMRGTGTGYLLNDFDYTNTNLSPLVTLASDWVRYTNFIVQNGVQNANDQAILDKIDWSYWSAAPKLPSANEGALPKIKYWEIGNEPEIEIDGKWFSSNLFDQFQGAWTTTEYVNRYKAITAAMKAVDPTIKVGPGMLGGVEMTTMPLLNSNATIDFWGYHPYDNLGDDFVINGNASQINAMEAQLRGVRTNQITKMNALRQAFTNAGRNPDNVEFMATEWNAMDFRHDNPSMYQALGFAETIFTFAQLKVNAAHYWGWLAYTSGDDTDPTYPDNLLYPMVKVWDKMNQEMGDTRVNSIVDDANNLRVYTMRDSQTGQITIWALNFDNDADKSINLALLGIDVASIATLNIINNPNDLDLDSAMGNWTVQQIQNFNGDNFQLDIPQASLMMLQVQAIPEPASMTLLGIGLIALLARRKAARNV
jgi:hypothetical protein